MCALSSVKNNRRTFLVLRLFPVFVLICAIAFQESPALATPTGLDRPPAANEIDYSPADGEETSVNPPPFVWLPSEGADRYRLAVSRSPDFSSDETVVWDDIGITVHVPTTDFEAGRWYWRYGFRGEDRTYWSRAREFFIAEDAVSLPFPEIGDLISRLPESRPRTYYSPEALDRIRANPEGRLAEIVEEAVEMAEGVLAREEELFPEPEPWGDGEKSRRRYVETFREMRPYTRGMEISAKAYLFTGDERFADEARRRLMHFMTWDVDGPSSAIWPGELGMDIAERAPRTFDWIYDTLTDEERAKCIDVLGRRIAQIHRLHRSMPFESQPFASHPGRMIGFVIEGALVLAHEIPEAKDWIEYTLKVLWSVYPAWGGEDGGWHEGVSYWGFYLRRMSWIVTELDRLGIPVKDRPFFRNTGWFGFYTAYPGRPQRAFGDAYEEAVDGWFSRHVGEILYNFSSLHGNPYFRWRAKQHGAGAAGPVAVSAYEPDIAPKSPDDLPHSRLFKDVGVIAMHSDLADPEENVMFLMQSSPYGSVSHNHANQNAFTLDAFGESLAISSGYYQTYGTGHHAEWVWQTRAHNAILVGGEGQTPRSRHAHGEIVAYEENGDWCYAAGDATAAYEGRLRRFVRHVVFVRPDYFVIIDDLESSGEPVTFEWLLHARETMNVDGSRSRVTVEKGDARLRVDFLKPAPLSFDQVSGWDPPLPVPEEAPPQFHLTASTTTPKERVRFVTVMFPHREATDENLPEARLLEAQGGIAVAVGGDRVLWKADGADEVRTGSDISRRTVEVIRER